MRRRLLLPDLGATRHILLIGLVGMGLVAAFHWQVRVGCLFDGVAFNPRIQGAVIVVC